jgi:hypothetical protein
LTSKEVPPDSQWHRWAEIACVVEQQWSINNTGVDVSPLSPYTIPVGRRQLVRNMCRQNRMSEENAWPRTRTIGLCRPNHYD